MNFENPNPNTEQWWQKEVKKLLELGQTPEQIRKLAEEAYEKLLLTNMVIQNSSNPPSLVVDCIIERMEGDDLDLTQIENDGDVGELIPVSLGRVMAIVLKEPFQPPEEK